jgi:hypothetical protein
MDKLSCSCAEIAGEDPRCILHGKGTRWGKENPDFGAISDRIGDLEDALRPFAEACDNCIGDDEAEKASTWEHPVGMEVTIGHFRSARATLSGSSSVKT